MKFPIQMTAADRWMVRHKKSKENETKQPESVHESKPEEYIGEWHRTRWGQSYQWVDYDTANDYRLTHPDCDYLCFVLRDIDPEVKTRFICFDFDGCIDEAGRVLPEVDEFVRETNSYAEFSMNGHGIHVISSYHGPPLKKCRREFGACIVDVITTGQVVVTGDVYDGFDNWNSVDYEATRERFDMKLKTLGDGGRTITDCWGPEFSEVADDKKYLEADMEAWDPCIEGEGGDNNFFVATCHLARHGVTGEAARQLLARVDCRPPFSDEETTHKIESAFLVTQGDGEFNAYRHGRIAAHAQFEAVEPIEEPEPAPDVSAHEGMTDEEAAFFKETGFEGLELARHLVVFSRHNMPAFILQDIMFETGALIIGGQNKTFKTTVGLDLLVSLATGSLFLDELPIQCKTKSIAVFSHETIKHHMSQYLEDVMAAKGLKPHHFRKSFTINTTVPPFVKLGDGQMKKNTKFETYLQRKRPDIAFFDPLYLMLVGINQADISEMGQALSFIEKTCAKYGTMAIFAHHSRKPEKGGTEFPIMTLNDLSGASGGAFARQWLLLSHTQNYVDGAGRLHMCVGASGADQHNYIVKVETYDRDHNRVWSPVAFKQNLEDEIVHRLQVDGTTTMRQLASRLNSTDYAIEQACHRLEDSNRVEITSNTKVNLVSQTSGEVPI